MTDPDPKIGWPYGTPLYKIVEYFYCERTTDDEMTLPQMDGFMTALAVGPTRPEPERWIQKILLPSRFTRKTQPWFRNDAHRQAVHAAFTARMMELDAAFAGRFEDYHPAVAWRPESDAARIEQWAEGFLDGIGFVEWPWLPMLEDARGSDLIRPAWVCTELAYAWLVEGHLDHPVLPPPYGGAEGVAMLRRIAWETASWWRTYRQNNVVSLH